MAGLKNTFALQAITTMVWALVALSGWYWIQATIAARKPAVVDERLTPKMHEANSSVVARLLGANSSPKTELGPNLSTRFVLSGIVASALGQGAALIAVDGKPARPFAVGTELAPGFVLVSVSPREATLAENSKSPALLVLRVPLLSAQPLVATAALGPVPGSSNAAVVLGVPATGASGSQAVVAPSATESVPAVPGRADARRQPQTSLRRSDQRTP